jgi:hypothetical protein
MYFSLRDAIHHQESIMGAGGWQSLILEDIVQKHHAPGSHRRTNLVPVTGLAPALARV